MIAPHKSNWKKAPTQGGKRSRRYKCRRKVGRLFSRLQKFHRIATRLALHDEIYLGLAHTGCMQILPGFYL